MNVEKIVIKYLKEHGYDGLVSWDGDCGCEISDLAPCCEPISNCSPAYKIPCPCPPGECEFNCGADDWHMTEEKPKKQTEENR